jgi:hypothetical protein
MSASASQEPTYVLASSGGSWFSWWSRGLKCLEVGAGFGDQHFVSNAAQPWQTRRSAESGASADVSWRQNHRAGDKTTAGNTKFGPFGKTGTTMIPVARGRQGAG